MSFYRQPNVRSRSRFRFSAKFRPSIGTVGSVFGRHVSTNLSQWGRALTTGWIELSMPVAEIVTTAWGGPLLSITLAVALVSPTLLFARAPRSLSRHALSWRTQAGFRFRSPAPLSMPFKTFSHFASSRCVAASLHGRGLAAANRACPVDGQYALRGPGSRPT